MRTTKHVPTTPSGSCAVTETLHSRAAGWERRRLLVTLDFGGLASEGVLMPIHDWARVDAGIFHHFHLEWIGDLSLVLNSGLLPPDYYALAEQIAGGLGPDVLTLQRPASVSPETEEPAGGLALAAAPPRVRFRSRAEPDQYAAKARTVVIRHASHHKMIAMVEIVSAGNKSSQHRLRTFVEKAAQVLRSGIHLVIVDLFPPGLRDPGGIQKAIRDEFIENEFALPPDKPLTLAAYIGGPFPEAFIEPVAVGSTLVDMPLFLTTEVYVPLPLESTYHSAWEAVPSFWRAVLTASGSS
jgi:hypothetical protein